MAELNIDSVLEDIANLKVPGYEDSNQDGRDVANDVSLPRLDQRNRRLLDFIEQYWFSNQGKFPSQRALQAWGQGEGISPEEVTARLNNKVEPYLKHRGIRGANSLLKLQFLEPRQLAAANLVLNFVDRRSTTAKLKALGVTPTEWAGWIKEENFRKYVAARTDDLLTENKHEAKLGLLRGVEKGDSGTLKLFFEMTGEYKNVQDEQFQNLKVVMARFFEILQLKIRDRGLLEEIALEFEAVVSGVRAAEAIENRTLEGIAGVADGFSRDQMPFEPIETVAIEKAKEEKEIDFATANIFDL